MWKKGSQQTSEREEKNENELQKKEKQLIKLQNLS